MNASVSALRAGVRRGLTEFGISLRTPSEVSYILLGVVIVAVVLWLNRDAELAPGVLTGTFILASVLTIQLVFVTCYGLGTTIAFLTMIQLSRAIGISGFVPPIVAAWLPSALFLTLGGWLLARARS